MVSKIPAAREAKARLRALTAFEDTQIRSLAMTMETVSFTLVTEETRIGGELNSLTILVGAAVWLDVRVQVLAKRNMLEGRSRSCRTKSYS